MSLNKWKPWRIESFCLEFSLHNFRSNKWKLAPRIKRVWFIYLQSSNSFVIWSFHTDSVTRLVYFEKSYKSSPNIWRLLGLGTLIIHNFSKYCCDHFLGQVFENWATSYSIIWSHRLQLDRRSFLSSHAQSWNRTEDLCLVYSVGHWDHRNHLINSYTYCNKCVIIFSPF